MHQAALDEFDGMVNDLRERGVHVMVVEDDPTTDTPDALFPNNWVSFHADGRVGLYPMFAPNRRLERREDILHDLVHVNGFDMDEIVDFTEFERHDAFLEGTGSMVLDRVHGKAYAALSPRTDRDAFAHWCESMDLEGVIFEANQTVGDARMPIYHTNVMMAVGTGWAAVCLDSIDHPDDRALVLESLQGRRPDRRRPHRRPNQPLRRQHARSGHRPRRQTHRDEFPCPRRPDRRPARHAWEVWHPGPQRLASHRNLRWRFRTLHDGGSPSPPPCPNQRRTRMIHGIDARLHQAVLDTFEATFGKRPADRQIQIQTTRAEFEGDRTLVVFPSQAWPGHLRMSPPNRWDKPSPKRATGFPASTW